MKLTRSRRIIAPTVFIASAMPICLFAQQAAAQEGNSEPSHVKLVFSGTSENSATNLQEPNTSNDEDNFSGKGALGSFTVRLVRAISNSPSASSSCSGATKLFLAELSGGGVFRFHDGGLLYVKLTEGSDCIDLAANDAHCTLTFKITGGTGRFKNASGVLTMTEFVLPVLADALNNPAFFAATGKFTGTISGVAREDDRQEESN